MNLHVNRAAPNSSFLSRKTTLRRVSFCNFKRVPFILIRGVSSPHRRFASQTSLNIRSNFTGSRLTVNFDPSDVWWNEKESRKKEREKKESSSRNRKDNGRWKASRGDRMKLLCRLLPCSVDSDLTTVMLMRRTRTRVGVVLVPLKGQWETQGHCTKV